MDKVLIEGLRCKARVGVLDWERERRQPIELDLELGLDLKPAGQRDQVEKTIDYAAVAAEVKRLVERGSFRLAEAVAEQTAQLLLKNFKADWVRVWVRKFSVPGTKSVGAEVTRGRWRRSSRSPRGAPR